jgi:hypothetical protein
MISVIGLFVFFYLVYNMLSLNVIAISFKNIIYILIKSNNNQSLLLNLKKIEYKLNKIFYKLIKKNNKFY